MRNKFIIVIFVYSLVLSGIFGCFTIVDQKQLDYAVKVEDVDKELRHRINVFADGTWFMLSNILGICCLGFYKPDKLT